MANRDTFDIAQQNITEWEGGGEHFDPETGMWTAYDDEVGGNIPTLGPGITGSIGDQQIEIGGEYSKEQVDEEYKKRMQKDYDWLEGNIPNWGELNPNQQASAISLVHNVGATAFSKSNAFKHLGAGELDKFAFEAFNPDTGFVYAGGEQVKGLQNRRAKEQELFESPWEDPVEDTMADYNRTEEAFISPDNV